MTSVWALEEERNLGGAFNMFQPANLKYAHQIGSWNPNLSELNIRLSLECNHVE